MKQIKKISIILLMITVSVFSAGCQKYTLMSPKALELSGIPDLPKLDYNEYTRSSQHTFYATLTYEQFESYVIEVYTYLSTKFSYVGIEEKMLDLCSYLFKQGNAYKDFIYTEKDGCIKARFIYANELGVAGNNYYFPNALKNWNNVVISFYDDLQEKSESELSAYKFNTAIFTYNVSVSIARASNQLVYYHFNEEKRISIEN